MSATPSHSIVAQSTQELTEQLFEMYKQILECYKLSYDKLRHARYLYSKCPATVTFHETLNQLQFIAGKIAESIQKGKKAEARISDAFVKIGINLPMFDTKLIGHDFQDNYLWAMELSKNIGK